MRKFRILTIDGGGLKGVVPLTILKKVEQLIAPKKIWEYFDFVAGTSTGGLITCAITLEDNEKANAKYSLDDIMDVYIKRGKEIFPPKNDLQKILHDATDIWSPTFSDSGIAKVFSDVLGQATMNDCLKPIMISTYDLTNNLPLFFKSIESKKDISLNARLYDICRATSAGPTYLPTYCFNYPKNPDTEKPNRNCIDGGVYVNNPGMAALAEFSKNHAAYLPETAEDTDIDYEKVFVLSVGTGSYSESILASESQAKGELYWAKTISDIMMRGVNRTTDYEMTEMMETGNYLRLNIDIDTVAHSDMANSTEATTNYLIEATQDQILNNTDKMKALNNWLLKSL
jgi:patatin-like phospholipase/acyl hydrolase